MRNILSFNVIPSIRDSQPFDFHVVMGMHLLKPHAVVHSDAPPDEFSAIRAMRHVSIIASVQYGWNVKAATVYNILVRIPGTSSSKAIALVANYDTMSMIIEGGMTNESSGI